jgi:TonB family protein
MVQTSERKVLRIGLMKDGKLIEEKLLRKPSSVSIGQSEKCTFTLPVKGLPPVYPLLRVKNGKYRLMFHQKMQGKISINKQALNFQEIAKAGLSETDGNLQFVELSEENRGKIQVGDLTLLFQFIVPPPQKTRQQLPSRFKKTWIEMLDWPFLNILMVSLLLQFSSLGYLITRDYPPRKPDLTKISNRFMDLVKTPEKKKEAKLPPKEDKPKPKETEVKVVKDKDEPLPEPTTPENVQKRKQILTKKVTKKTVLKYLVSSGDGPGILGELSGEASRTAINEAFDGVGIAVANSSTSAKGVIGAENGKTIDVGDAKLKTGKRKKVRTGKKRKAPKPKLKLQKPSEAIGAGTLSSSSVEKTVRRRQGALKGCYESELKKDDSLKGKIKVQFTIETSGRVSSVKVIQNTMGSRAVAKCISSQMKRWRFPKPSGGSVTIAYPFVFTPSR